MSIEHTAGMSPMKVTPDYLTRVFRDTYRDDPRAWLRVAAKICPALTVGEALDLLENRAEFQAASDETVIVVPCEAEPAPRFPHVSDNPQLNSDWRCPRGGCGIAYARVDGPLVTCERGHESY